MKARPLKLTFELAFPISLNHRWLHFDGIIGHTIWARSGDRYEAPTKQECAVDPGKFKRAITLKYGIPAASVGVFECDEYRSTYYQKRTESEFFHNGKLDIGSGYFRAWRMLAIYNPSLRISFYCHGRRDLIEELLGDVTHLGDNVRLGWGMIRDMRIEQIDRDYSIVRDGIAMRPIPVRCCSEYSEAYPLAWRSPYWSAKNIELCAPPGAKVRLKRNE